MTHIVSPQRYPSKKAFKAATEANPNAVYLDDPSIIDPVSGSVRAILNVRQSITVTNHPKRSWFAAVTQTRQGKVVVK